MQYSTIPISKETLEKFLKPVQKISEGCVIKISNSDIYTVCSSSDSSIILYARTNIYNDIDEDIRLNILNIKKLILGLNILKDGNFSLQLYSNNIKCQVEDDDGNKEHFIYHLADDSIIKQHPINIKKIASLSFDTTFTINFEIAKKLLASSVFSEDAGKVYISMDEDKIIAEINDKTVQNIDNIKVVLAKHWSGERLDDDIALNIDIFKNLISSKNDITVKINKEFKIVIFQINNDEIELKYIVSTLIK